MLGAEWPPGCAGLSRLKAVEPAAAALPARLQSQPIKLIDTGLSVLCSAVHHTLTRSRVNFSAAYYNKEQAADFTGRMSSSFLAPSQLDCIILSVSDNQGDPSWFSHCAGRANDYGAGTATYPAIQTSLRNGKLVTHSCRSKQLHLLQCCRQLEVLARPCGLHDEIVGRSPCCPNTGSQHCPTPGHCPALLLPLYNTHLHSASNCSSGLPPQ